MNPWHLDPSPDKSASIWWDMTKGCTMPSVFAHMDNVAIEVPSKVSRSIKSQFMDPKHDALEEEFPFNYGDFFGVHVSL